jgi:hypothetical protein
LLFLTPNPAVFVNGCMKSFARFHAKNGVKSVFKHEQPATGLPKGIARRHDEMKE